MVKTDWKEYLSFSKKERIALVILVFFILLFIIAPFFYHPFKSAPAFTVSSLQSELDKLATNSNDSLQTPASYTNNSTKATSFTLFYFNPNTATADELKQLGLRDKTVATLINYRSKGGVFRTPIDLSKLYGLTKEEAERLMPFVKITGQQQQHSFLQNDKQYVSSYKQKPQVININTATVEQWKALPMIGDALSSRIVKYRDKIGGFRTIEQVRTTYGVSDSTFALIKPFLTITNAAQTSPQQPSSASSFTKININTATEATLKSNPAIKENIAKAIVIYRQQHGKFSSVEDLKKIVFINEQTFTQIAPFLTAE